MEPYRFFGLKLENCDFESVRFELKEVALLEKYKLLPTGYIEQIKSEVKKEHYVRAIKLALCLFTNYFTVKTMKQGWFQIIFEKQGSSDYQRRLRKIMEFLEKPFKDNISTPVDISSFLELIYTRDRIFKRSKVRHHFFRELHLTPGDRENFEREAKKSCDLRRRMLKQSLFVEYSEISCLFDVVKALLRTKAHIERENVRQARRIQRLLDDLGKHLEERLFQDDDNDDDDDDW